jgi:hypothetical protein
MTDIHYKLSPVPHGTGPRAVCGAIGSPLTRDKQKVTCKDCLAWAVLWWGSLERWNPIEKPIIR